VKRTLLTLGLSLPTLLAVAPPSTDAATLHSARLSCMDGDAAACQALAQAPPPSAEPAMPPLQHCLAGSFQGSLLGEGEAPRPQGLSAEQISLSLEAFLPRTLQCVPEGQASTEWRAELTVACDGQVERAEVVDPGGLSPAVVGCLEHMLREARFPAHDAPDGVTFVYPARFTVRRAPPVPSGALPRAVPRR